MKILQNTRLIAAAAFGAVIAPVATPASAATLIVTAADFDQFRSIDGGAFAPTLSVAIGRDGLSPSSYYEYRVALEFALSGLPSGASIGLARLGLRAANSNGAGTIVISGYAGDGSITTGDLTAGTDIASYAPTTTNVEYIDVTALVAGLYASNEDYAGFALRQSPLGVCSNAILMAGDNCYAAYNGANSPSSQVPRLEITYDIAPVPEPAAWAMMIAGFGIVGGALRGRKVRVALA